MKFRLPPEVLARAKADETYLHQHKIVGMRLSLSDDLAGQMGAAIAAVLTGDAAALARAGRAGIATRTATDPAAAFFTPPVARQKEYALFLHLDFDAGQGEVVYNGPEGPVADVLDDDGAGSEAEATTLKMLRALNARVADGQRLRLGKIGLDAAV